MNNIKNQFPIFEKESGLTYLDSGATTLKPRSVIEKMMDYYTNYSANIHRGVYGISEQATTAYENAREKVAKFIGVEDPSEIIFTKGTTESINLVARGWGDKKIIEGDEIIVTEMEHHSNLVPWQELAKREGGLIKYIKLGQNHKLDLSELAGSINENTRILAITQVSNVLGAVNQIKQIADVVHDINPEVVIVVDGAQAVAHMPVNVAELGCDFYAFSGHKMYGPTGIGVLWGKKMLLDEMDPVNFGGGMIGEVSKLESTWAPIPDKFEGGTPPIAEAIGLGAAVDFLENFGLENISDQENEVAQYALSQLATIEGLKIFSAGEAGIMAMELSGVHAHDVATILDREGVCVRAGHHCAMPLHQILGAGATFRVSLGIYNTKEDIDKLIVGIKKAKDIFKV
jgi:cysteine desulfurase/selenocysteine lyase